MPSIIQRMRRGSETTNRPEQTGSPGKRLSIDVSQMDHSEAPKSGKLKGLFGKHDEGGGGDGPNKLDSLKKKLTSPSTIFKHQPSEGLDNRPITPPQDQEISDPTLARYAAAAPLTPPRAVNGSPRFPSPATSPQQFSLSRSRSPENGSHRNSWTPSYPLVVPDDGYADIAPDGHAVSPPKNTAPIAGSNENSRRRSMQLDAPPRTLDDIQPIQPDRPKVTAKISPDSGLPTPPTSSDSRDTIPTAERPSLSLETDLAKPAPATETSAASSEATPLAAPFSPTPTSPTLATPASPTSADPSRPAKPVRQRTNLITSPPMPQPIKNLPTLAGWSGISNQPFAASPTTPRTPGWGALAREGGPKTPGGMMSPRTPGANGGGFPFIRQPLPRQTSKGPMSDGELRKAKRAMPVMLREPSFKPPVQEDGEVGASDDDDDEESETEVEAGHQDDSEDETETDAAKAKGKKKAVPLRQRLKGNKKQPKAATSPGVGITAVSEEVESPPASSSAAGSSGSASTPNASMWSLPTPKEKPMSSVWASFRSNTPGSAAPQRPDNSDETRSSSYQTTNDSYFGSQPGSSVNVTTSSLPIEATAQQLKVDAPLDPAGDVHPPPPVNQPGADDDEDADGGSEDGDDTASSQGHSSMTHASPQQISPAALPDARPSAPTRPSMYHQVSQSMVNLGANRSDSACATGDKASARPNLETIRSREGAPTKIELPKPKMSGVGSPLFTPGSEWAKPPPTPAAGFAGMFWNRKDGEKPAALKRRRSAGDTSAAPPDYEPPHPGVVIPRPRDEEGREKLPKYWCAVHIEGNLARKMEFSAPGVQSRDRSWKKHYYILRGTALFVYKFDPHRFPLKVDHPIVPTTNEEECEENLHVHMPGERRVSLSTTVAPGGASPRRSSLDGPASAGAPAAPGSRRGSISAALTNIATDTGRRGSLPGPSPLSAGAGHARQSSGSSSMAAAGPSTGSPSAPNSDGKDTQLFNTPRKASVSSVSSATSQSTSIASHFQQNQLIKVYTLQNAESGLAADYVKRKNVVRVRSEGEQFLLQTDSARDVVDWIEAFQSATNVALDLDDRPMPKIITLPRRRRRRIPAPGAAAAAAGAAAPATDAAPPGAADTPEGNAAAVAAAEAASRDRERMLAEDQSGTPERT